MDKEKPLPTLMENKEESEKIEFKETLKLLDEIGETVSAFSNAGSGIIVVGVSDSGKVMGVHTGKNTLEELASYIKRNTDPQVYPSIKTETVENKRLILINVLESRDKPVFFKGHAYKRVGKSTLELGSSEIRKLAKDSGGRIYWDNRICEGAGLEDIDEEKVKWFLRKAKHERNFDIEEQTPVKEALERLELVKDDGLTNAAVLLFGANPQKFFLQAETRCGRFKGTKPVKPFTDMKVFGGNVIDQVDKSLNFALEHTPMKVYLAGKPEREEKYEYPPDAIREAIINAVCHRDYELSSNVQVRVFDDRIEIWGCGSLPKPLTPEDLKKKHKSILRNPLIAKCLFLIKFVEHWGTGTNDIMDMCLEWGLPEPLFEELAGDFVLTFRKYMITEESMEKLPEKEKQIVKYIQEKGKISRKECIDLLAVSPVTAFRHFKALKKKKIIRSAGKGKNVHYALA